MRNTAHQTRVNRTITIDFHNEATYVQLLGGQWRKGRPGAPARI
jgi:hypothetical protein